MLEFAVYDWTASAAPEYGGNLFRLAWRGNELLRTPERPEILAENPEVYGIPVLFPPGRIDGGRFLFDGRECRLPVNEPERGNHLHGLALRRAWRVAAAGPDRLRMELEFGPGDPEYAGFPFAFTLALEYRFRPDRLEQRLTVRNRGERRMPCAAGFHTVFRAPRRLRVEAGPERWEIPWPRCLATGRKLAWDSFDPRGWFGPDALLKSCQFPAPPGPHRAELDYGDFRLRYRVDGRFRQWYLWSREPGSGFIAVEPMCCVSGGFQLPELPPEESGIFALAPGAECVFDSELSAELS